MFGRVALQNLTCVPDVLSASIIRKMAMVPVMHCTARHPEDSNLHAWRRLRLLAYFVSENVEQI
jgi:hypothetical protein